MRRFAETADAISATRSRLRKVAILTEYLRGLPENDLRSAAIFFTARPFPLFDSRTLNVGWAAVIRVVQEISGASDQDVHNAYLERGDLGEVAERVLPAPVQADLRPARVSAIFDEIVAASGTAAKQSLVRELLSRLTPAEAKYIVKVITGDLRIGLKESTVEEAVAKAFDRPVEMVRRTNMSLGDIGETAILAKHDRMAEAALRLFRPIKFMLATAAESEQEIFDNFSGPFYIEDKYDGIRGQLHVDASGSAIYSRTLDDVSHQFPELGEAARNLSPSLIADGEIVAFLNNPGRNEAQVAFGLLQKRLGRKKPSPELLSEIPVGFMVFDLLHFNGHTLIDEPLSHRKKLLQEIVWPEPFRIAPFTLAEERPALEPFFEESAMRRNEGLMLKDAASVYVPGKRGMSWLKWKKALATLDVVVTGVEYGHGRRRDVLSDYTFAVRAADGKLLNIGKAYSGLTDREIVEMTEFFKQHTVHDYGRFRVVEPIVVIEVAFNGIQESQRHASGLALRFPRIVRVRPDKGSRDIDTLETARKIYASHVGLNAT